MRFFVLLLAFSMLVFSACTNTASRSSDAIVSSNEVPSDVPAATAEASQESKEIVEPANEPASASDPTPTVTSLNPTNMEEVEQTYKALVMIQAVAEALGETASRVQNGELEGFESLGAIIAVGAMAKGIEDIMPEIAAPDYLASELRAARSLNNDVRTILGRWMDQEIDSSEVLAELAPLLDEIDSTVTDAEEKLAREAGLDTEKLTETRREAMESVAQAFETAPAATSEPVVTSEPPEGEKIALNFVGEQDSGGVTVEIGRVLVGDKALLEYDLGRTFSGDIFADKNVVGEVIFVITNNSDQTVNLYPLQGSAQINSEQIDFFDYMFADVRLGEDIDGELFPGVQKIGGLWFGIKRSSLDEIDQITFRIAAPASSEKYQRLGEGYEITVDLSNRIFEPLPEELK